MSTAPDLCVGEVLNTATAQLEQAGISTARLDALILLEDISGHDRAWILAHPEHELRSPELTKLKKLLSKRASHIPLAYVRGVTEFYAREFIITPAVLQPRPESETMIDVLKKLVNDHASTNNDKKIWNIADVGSGSGALGITAQLELPQSRVTLLDIDSEALKVSKINVDKFTLGISCFQSDLLAESKQNFDILLCNLPYVPDDYHINTAALHEPRIAIFGGTDGLDVYRELFTQLKMVVQRPLYILCEALPPQHKQLISIAKQYGYNVLLIDDFIVAFGRHESS